MTDRPSGSNPQSQYYFSFGPSIKSQKMNQLMGQRLTPEKWISSNLPHHHHLETIEINKEIVVVG
jgi:hypothetical protein